LWFGFIHSEREKYRGLWQKHIPDAADNVPGLTMVITKYSDPATLALFAKAQASARYPLVNTSLSTIQPDNGSNRF